MLGQDVVTPSSIYYAGLRNAAAQSSAGRAPFLGPAWERFFHGAGDTRDAPR